MSRGLLLALVVAGSLGASCAPPAAETRVSSMALSDGPAAAPVGFTVQPLALPTGVVRLQGGFWLENGEILAAARVPQLEGARIGVFAPNGGAFRCITCGSAMPTDLGRAQPFGDQRRILAQSPSASNVLQDFEHWVLACTPSIAQCDSVQAERVRGMPTSPQGLQERWPAVSPDGQHIAWTRLTTSGYRVLFADLQHGADGYVVSHIRVLNPLRAVDTVAALVEATAWYEVKGFTEDGQGLLVGSTRGGTMNLDAFVLDLASGAWTRLTTDPDWDEDHELSPDGQTMIVGSARGEDTLTPFSLVPMPPLLDFALVAPVTYFHIGGTSRRSGRRAVWRFPLSGDGSGQRLAPTPGSESVLATGPEVSVDGRSILFGERVPGAEDRDLFVGTLDVPAHPPVVPQPTPIPAWAPSLEDANALPDALSQLVRGPRGGLALVSWAGGTLGGTFSVVYTRFVTSEGYELVGTQRYLGGPLLGRYEADVRVSGAQTGRVEADLSIINTERAGFVRATLGARTVEHRYPVRQLF